MGIKLKVPLVTQSVSMECWYASACMVAYYRRPGPRLGLPDKWIANNGITISDFIRLAQAEKLKSISTPARSVTSQQLEILLRSNGPIWCAGYWDGVPHIVVLTGVEGKNVFINDPNPSKGVRVETIDWFNQRLSRVPNCMMYMPV